VNRPQIVIHEAHIPARYLKRRGAVAEDALQGEDVAAVREESAREAMPEDVRGAPLRQTGGEGKAADELLDCAGRKSASSPSHEERIVRSLVALQTSHLDAPVRQIAENSSATLRALVASTPISRAVVPVGSEGWLRLLGEGGIEDLDHLLS
jgi:hypothetical protein